MTVNIKMYEVSCIDMGCLEVIGKVFVDDAEPILCIVEKPNVDEKLCFIDFQQIFMAAIRASREQPRTDMGIES
ncbi:hypothetical protein Aduo_011775 [Ancylostoma duodenale]